MVIRQLWASRYLDFAKSFILLATVMAIFIVQNMARGILNLNDDLEIPFISNEVIKFSGTLSLIAERI
jgi:hypothetical protein